MTQSYAFVRLLSNKSLVQEGGMFEILRKHRSEGCGRRLCLVINKSCIPLDIVWLIPNFTKKNIQIVYI